MSRIYLLALFAASFAALAADKPAFRNARLEKLVSETAASAVEHFGKAGLTAGTRAMMNLLHRDPFAKYEDPDDQASAYSGKSLPPGSQYYSKAGWTSDTRHDTAYIRLPNGAEYVLAVFTVDNSKQTDIIPFVSNLVAQEFFKAQ